MKHWHLSIVCLLLFVGVKTYGQDTVYARKMITELASEKYFGRGYCKDGVQKAAKFLIQEMENIGLQTHTQDFVYRVNRFPKTYRLSIDKQTYLPSNDFVVYPNTASIKGEFKIYNIPLRTLKDSAKLCNLPQRKGRNKFVALHLNQLNDTKYHRFVKNLAHNNFLNAKGYIFIENKEPIWFISHEIKNFSTIAFDGRDFPKKARKIKLDIDSEPYEVKTQNIIGFIPGKTKKTIVFTAHYDHLGGMGDSVFIPGAQDNASGVAMCLDIAKHYAQNPPDFNLVFLFFSGEEAGLIGSIHYAQNPTIPLKDINFLINLDMIGSGEAGITIVNAKNKDYASEFELFQRINKELSLNLDIKARGTAANSDHYPLNMAGVKGVFIYSRGGNTFYHHANDTQETVSLFAYHEIFKLITKFAESYER